MKNQTNGALRAALAFFLLCSTAIANATDYYFSSLAGDDSRTAAQAQSSSTPWKSVDKLNAIFATLKPGDNVFFKRGDVFSGTITAAASGNASSPITIGAYGSGVLPVVSGLVSLSNWGNTGDKIWEADASFATAINVALVNGTPQTIGRYPNATDANAGYLTYESHSGNASITDQQLASSTDWTGGEVVIRKNRWVLDRNKITAYNGNTIFYTSQSGYEASDNYGYFFQNHRAALDHVGEWYFNSGTKKVGIYNNGKPSGVEVSAVNTLLSIVNQNYIVVTNLQFKGSNANAIELSNATGVQILNCEILFAGANALLGKGCNGTRVEGCTITGTANSALEFRGSPNTVIKANTIKNTGFVAGLGGGDSGSYEAVLIDGDNETIEGNTIENTGYIPITFRGNSNTIKNNFINTYNTVKDDGGGIYTWNNIAGAAPTYGSKIIGNIVLNGLGAGAGTDAKGYAAANGIYMDDNTAGVEIANNSVANCGLYGLYVHNSYGLTITGNTFYNSSSQAVFIHDNYAPAAKIRNVLMNNNLFVAKDIKQLVAEFRTPDNDIASFGTFDNNYYCRPVYEAYSISTSSNPAGVNLDLTDWKTLFGKDAASKNFPVAAVSYDALRFEYNATATAKTVSLDGTYTDAFNTAYNGSITLQPFTSVVLVKQITSSAQCPGTPGITREQWNNVSGDLSAVPWQTTPAKKSTVTGALEFFNIGDTYGDRMSGYLCPPQTGTYTFYIAGDDNAELWLSTDANPANKRKIAYIPGWTDFRQWDKYGGQKSASIFLQADTRYYIEVLHKEGGGGDHVSVAWQMPNGDFEGPIPGHRFPSGTGASLQSQTINFASLTDAVMGSGTVTLSATASSGLPVSFVLVSGAATLNENTLTLTGVGTVVVKASQAGNSQYSAAADVTQQFAITAPASVQCSATGNILREQWNNVSGTAVSQIPVSTAPSSSSQLRSFEGPVDIADNYGSRIRGYVCPPQSGNYTFWIAGDDNVELWLSTSDDPSAKTKIAYHTAWTSFRQWTWYATQKSAAAYLIAGKKYYIEALQKQAAGGDNLSVAWTLPDGTMEAPIPGARLSPYAVTNTVLLNQTITFGTLPNINLGDAPLTLSATASSGLSVSYSIISGPATINGNVLTPTAAGTVIIRASQSGNAQYNAAPDATQTLTVLAPPAPTTCSATGAILREQWDGVSGTAVSQIPVNSTPSSSSQLLSFEAPTNIADNYGSRIRGFICPPQTGNYTFWIAGDDNVELWLSTTDDPSLKTKIAYHTAWTESRQWNWYATQKSASLYLTAGKKYYIEALQKQAGGGDNLSVAWQLPDGTMEAPIPGSSLSPYVPTVVVTPSACSATGTILREVWNNVEGNDVSAVPQSTTPPSSSQLTSFEGPTNAADRYASRVRGYLCPPQTGNYTFWIAGDDATELWLSRSDDPSAKIKIAYNLSWTNPREWTKYATQKSATVNLIAGKKYYIEALHKQGGGGDNLAVAWMLPDGTFEAPIAGNRLSPHTATATTTASVSTLLATTNGTTSIKATEAETNATSPTLNVYPNPFADQLTIEFTPAQAGQSVVEVYNAVGIRQAVLFNGVVQKGAKQRLVYRQATLAAGVYFVRYRSAGGTVVQKVLKRKG